jgi:hypothetical protein
MSLKKEQCRIERLKSNKPKIHNTVIAILAYKSYR